MADEYKLVHITDIANIPEDQFPQFLAELPIMYKNMLFIKSLEIVKIGKLLPELVWRNDGSDHIYVTLTSQGETLATVRVGGDSE